MNNADLISVKEKLSIDLHWLMRDPHPVNVMGALMYESRLQQWLMRHIMKKCFALLKVRL